MRAAALMRHLGGLSCPCLAAAGWRSCRSRKGRLPLKAPWQRAEPAALPAPALPRLQVQRSDDTEEKARNRLRTYHANVDAVIGYYKDQLVEVRLTTCACGRCVLLCQRHAQQLYAILCVLQQGCP